MTQNTYTPIQDGMDKRVKFVRYTEAKPPPDLAEFVHCLWELKTENLLAEDFQLHAVPDACVNILFNQLDKDIAGITALRTTFEVLTLGKTFHYAGIQLLPGVWQGNPSEIADSFVGTPYSGNLPLIKASEDLAGLKFPEKQVVMTNLVKQLVAEKVIVANPYTAKILSQFDEVKTVTDMARIADLSPRQLQRTLKRSTGLSPHDFLKVLRLQHSFKKDYLASYFDQSHYIHSFKKITGYTPMQYAEKFDV